MKQLFLFFVLMITGAIGFSQVKKAPPQKVPAKPAGTVLKTLSDSANYAIGIAVVNFYGHNFGRINTAIVSKGIEDAQAGKPRLMDDNQMQAVMMRYMNQLAEVKAKPTIDAGEKFLAGNKKRSTVKTTPSGLQYEVITQGTGPKPLATDTIVFHYIGKFVDGTEFDNSYKRGTPLEWEAGKLIQGWTEALVMMPVGSKWKLFIPYQLGYGLMGNQGIPGGAALIFDVELLGIKGK